MCVLKILALRREENPIRENEKHGVGKKKSRRSWAHRRGERSFKDGRRMGGGWKGHYQMFQKVKIRTKEGPLGMAT